DGEPGMPTLKCVGLQPSTRPPPVAVGIHVGSNRQAIDHRVLVPKVINHEPRPTGSYRIKTRGPAFRSLASDDLATLCSQSARNNTSPTGLGSHQPFERRMRMS